MIRLLALAVLYFAVCGRKSRLPIGTTSSAEPLISTCEERVRPPSAAEPAQPARIDRLGSGERLDLRVFLASREVSARSDAEAPRSPTGEPGCPA